jgi:hypothetical protein
VVVAPGLTAGSPLGLGIAAEAARPSYLTRCLGNPPVEPSGRQAWREAASCIEQFRNHWQIADDRHAFGPRRAPVGREAERDVQLAGVEQMAADVRRSGRLTTRRAPEEPQLGLGR